MRILIVSDTHKKHENFRTALQKAAPIDRVIHLGDAEGCENEIQEICGCPLDIIAGNNDFFSFLPPHKEIMLGKYKVLLTHGHHYRVNMGIEYLKNEALLRGEDIVMFGHTHVPLIERDSRITILNPGSIAYPRQPGRNPSYIVMEVEIEGENPPSFELCYL